MDLKIVFLCLVGIAVATGGTINTDKLRDTIHDNLLRRMRPGGGAGGGRGQNTGTNLFQIGKAVTRLLETVVEAILERISTAPDDAITDNLVIQLNELLAESEPLQALFDAIAEFVDNFENDDDTNSEETTTAAPETTTGPDSTEQPSTAAEPTTTEGTTAAAPEKRLLNLKKMLLRAVLNKLQDKNRK